ncbi:sulfotransferase family protein [Winogradskyella endarachnes]|uniref:Sulfotransferase domain-containing protein n=1 Tax=Winogradskyella endarachnes TaxID=2681965 RepID=A0A6L6UAU0_9FLAO|nr:sulfotransferase [Winogradskyella endarachnes]MUU77874.1 hypothetical protein [Winogradskyella endarachnes]
MAKNRIFLPNFFVVGAQKAGTTTFYEIFSKHKEVFIPQKKELRFFSYHYKKGIDWYLKKYFNLSSIHSYKAVGEVDPGYISNSLVPARIRQDIGENVKIIMIMRQPVKRAYSAYNMFKKFNSPEFKNWTIESFENQLNKENRGEVNSNFIAQGLYYQNYQAYKKEFGAENIKLIVFEDFIGNKRLEIVDEICEFLGILKFEKQVVPVHANKASLPKHKWLNFLYNSNPLMQRIRNILKSFPKLQGMIKNLLTTAPRKLSNAEINNITQLYFQDDINLLEKELGYKIAKWKV